MSDDDRAMLARLLSLAEREAARAVDRRGQALEHLLYGVCRGLGFTLGFSVLGAVVLTVLRSRVATNIPLIGGFLAEVIHAIEARM